MFQLESPSAFESVSVMRYLEYVEMELLRQEPSFRSFQFEPKDLKDCPFSFYQRCLEYCFDQFTHAELAQREKYFEMWCYLLSYALESFYNEENEETLKLRTQMLLAMILTKFPIIYELHFSFTDKQFSSLYSLFVIFGCHSTFFHNLENLWYARTKLSHRVVDRCAYMASILQHKCMSKQ